MKRANLVLGIIVFICPVTFGQVKLEWAVRYDSPINDWDTPLAIVVDDSGNVYVTGASPDTTTTSATIKYSQSGSQLWVRRFAYTGADLALDRNRNLYVTGNLTVKMTPNGDTLWTRAWLPFSGAKRIEIDTSGNAYLAGSILFDYGVEKVGSEGNVLWTRTYNSHANDDDQINDMVLDSQGNIIVTGQSWGIGTQWDYLTIKYSPDGDTLWARRYNGPAPPIEVPTDIAFAITADDSDNVYVTGWSDGVTGTPQCFTIKYSPAGDSLWGKRFPASGSVGYVGYDILNDPSGYIYVAARANGFEDRLLKYDRAGNLVWSATYPANHTFATNPPRLAQDRLGNIYVTSSDYVDPHAYYVVLKYNASNTRLWEFRYRPPGNAAFTTNNAYALAVDSLFNVYVTGGSYVAGTGTLSDYLTLKLSQKPTGVEPYAEQTPRGIELLRNYPNPFNATTKIKFAFNHTSHITLRIFNVLGQEIQTLVSDELQSGAYTVIWEAHDAPSGIYICRLQTERESKMIKLVLVK